MRERRDADPPGDALIRVDDSQAARRVASKSDGIIANKFPTPGPAAEYRIGGNACRTT